MKPAPNHSLILSAETPQYFPALDYFYKAAQAGVFVLADELQFSKHATINRCRIKTANGAQWLTVPVRTKGRFGQKIIDVEIDEGNDWRQKHWQCLTINYCRAAYFEKYAEALEGFFQRKWKNLADLNFVLTEWLCRILQINCRLMRGSELPAHTRGSERLRAWVAALGGNIYLCDTSERELLESKKLENTGIEVRSLEFMPVPYHQQFGEFMPHLSILDLILNEGDESRRILQG
ncbi:MAG: WbqC family protein [bacterium]